jgi:hypothetical protein
VADALGRRKEESEMETDLQGIDIHGVDQGVRGAWVRGDAPQELVLTDGSRLRLEPAEEGRMGWHRADDNSGGDERLSATEAKALAGDHARYVLVRTRAEVEWLRAVSDWCCTEATRLERELAA